MIAWVVLSMVGHLLWNSESGELSLSFETDGEKKTHGQFTDWHDEITIMTFLWLNPTLDILALLCRGRTGQQQGGSDPSRIYAVLCSYCCHTVVTHPSLPTCYQPATILACLIAAHGSSELVQSRFSRINSQSFPSSRLSINTSNFKFITQIYTYVHTWVMFCCVRDGFNQANTHISKWLFLLC